MCSLFASKYGMFLLVHVFFLPLFAHFIQYLFSLIPLFMVMVLSK